MSLIRKSTTEAVQAANRANSLKSTGPVTDAGKINVRMNALRHGMRAKGFRYVFEALGENRHAWFEMHNQIFRRLQPRDVFERQLAEEIAENRWRRLRVRRAEDGMLASQRLQFEVEYARKLAGEGRSAESVGEAIQAQKEGMASLPDSDPKFAFILQCLQAARQAVETEGFGEQGWKRLEAVYGPSPGLAGAALLASYRECQKAACDPDVTLPPEEERHNQKQAFLARMEAEISSFEKLQELHQVSGDQLVEAQVDTLAVLPAGDSDRVLRHEAFLDRQFDRLLKRYGELNPGWQKHDPSSALEDRKVPEAQCDERLQARSKNSSSKCDKERANQEIKSSIADSSQSKFHTMEQEETGASASRPRRRDFLSDGDTEARRDDRESSKN